MEMNSYPMRLNAELHFFIHFSALKISLFLVFSIVIDHIKDGKL